MINPKNRWWVRGLLWGTFMFLIMTLAFPYFQGEPLLARNVIFGVFVWTITGLIFGRLVTPKENAGDTTRNGHQS